MFDFKFMFRGKRDVLIGVALWIDHRRRASRLVPN
jgi:hypothetical protein